MRLQLPWGSGSAALAPGPSPRCPPRARTLCWYRATACQDSRLLSSTHSQGIIRYVEFIALLAALLALLQPRVIGIKERRVAPPLRLAHGSQGLLVNKKQGQCHAWGGGWGSGWVPLCTSSIPTSSLWHRLSPLQCTS